MNIKGKVTLDVHELAAILSNEHDGEQAAFFNTFFKALKVNCESNWNYQMQMTSIFGHLTKQTLEALAFMAGDEE